MNDYYKTAAERYRAAAPEIRQASRDHWTRAHAENMKNGNEDQIIFSALILAAYDAADAAKEA